MKALLILLVFLFSISSMSAQDNWEIINTGINEHLHDIEFINDSIGFVYSYGTGNIYQTRNAGASWEIIKQTDSIYYEQIQFVNSKTAWICGERGSLLKTSNGGNSWEDISIKDNNSLLLYGMYFLNDSTGYISGAEIKDRKMLPKAFTTRDGGISWTEIFEDIPHMILNIQENGNFLFATGSNFINRIKPKTKDWEYVFRDTLRSTGQIRDLKFNDKITGIAVSFNGNVLITNDGGNSFSSKRITKNRLRSIAFIGKDKWIAVGDNNNTDGAVLYVSENNGDSWQKFNDFPDIHRITLTNKHIWIVGKNGLIAKQKR
ncbi:WD40/YVTN/BNR-like repeat-containing protein [Bacteroidota bacterium]